MQLLFIGTQEILIIALVVILLFGGKKIPELMKGLGKGVKSFKDGMTEVNDELKKDVTTSEKNDSDTKTKSSSSISDESKK